MITTDHAGMTIRKGDRLVIVTHPRGARWEEMVTVLKIVRRASGKAAVHLWSDLGHGFTFIPNEFKGGVMRIAAQVP